MKLIDLILLWLDGEDPMPVGVQLANGRGYTLEPGEVSYDKETGVLIAPCRTVYWDSGPPRLSCDQVALDVSAIVMAAPLDRGQR